MAPRLGREERLEQVALRFIVHPHAGVAHRERGIAARTHGRVLAGERFVDHDGARDDLQATAAGHRVPRVHHEVHHRLLELRRIHPHRAALGG